jgi:hypothetical protein
METKNQIKSKENKSAGKPAKKHSGKAVQVETTPVTEKTNPRAGRSLKNEGTNFTYEEER